jgi:hypothetical protein
MIKSILVFLFFTIVFAASIQTFVNLGLKEKWALTKVVGYAILCSLLALSVLTIIVILF